MIIYNLHMKDRKRAQNSLWSFVRHFFIKDFSFVQCSCSIFLQQQITIAKKEINVLFGLKSNNCEHNTGTNNLSRNILLMCNHQTLLTIQSINSLCILVPRLEARQPCILSPLRFKINKHSLRYTSGDLLKRQWCG